MNFVISVKLIPFVNLALNKNDCRIYDLLEYTCKYSGSHAYTERLVSSDHTPYCENNVSCLKSHTTSLYDNCNFVEANFTP